MAKSTKNLLNNLSMYLRVEGGVWHSLEVLIKTCIRLSLQCKYTNLLFTIFLQTLHETSINDNISVDIWML